MQELTDLFYSSITDGAHAFDFYSNQNTAKDGKPPLICFVHGGAWRSEDKKDHAELARRLCARTSYTVAVPNYRLTTIETPLHHPGHTEDILAFLEHIRDLREPFAGEQPYDRDRIYLMGHSCSAHMLASMLLESPHPSIRPSAGLLRAVRAVVFSEGIYDIDLLLKSFPSYREWFIAPAFGNRDSYKDDAVSAYAYREGGAHIRWLIIHSKGDTLVDPVQSQTMYEHLLSLEGGQASSTKVLKNLDTLDMEHNDILKADGFIDTVGGFFS